MIERVSRLRDEAASGAPPEALLARIEDALSEGYAQALAGDAWSTRTERALHELISESGAPARARELRALTSRHARFQRELIALRRELAGLRRDRDRLRADSPARSA